MKRLLVALLVATPLLFVASQAEAQTDPAGKLFLGYSYLRTEIGDADAGDAHGGRLQYTYYLSRRAGFTISAAGHWGELPAPPNVFVVGTFDLQQLTLMAGATVVLERTDTLDLELSVLGGAVRRELEVPGFGSEISSEWDPALSASLALDLRLSESIWLRALEPGVVFTRIGDDWETDYRISAGIVIRSGEIIS